PAWVASAAHDPMGNDRIGFEIGCTVNRKDWGNTWNAPLEACWAATRSPWTSTSRRSGAPADADPVQVVPYGSPAHAGCAQREVAIGPYQDEGVPGDAVRGPR